MAKAFADLFAFVYFADFIGQESIAFLADLDNLRAFNTPTERRLASGVPRGSLRNSKPISERQPAYSSTARTRCRETRYGR